MTKTVLLSALLLGLSATAALSLTDDAFRREAQSACMGDVMMLCASSIPDEASIISCMKGRRSQLSEPCRQVFDTGLKSSRRQQTMR